MSNRIRLDELGRLPTFHLPVASWSGRQLAFCWDRTGRMELYLLDLDNRELRQLSRGEAPRSGRSGLVWSRDGRRIIFARDSEGDEQHQLLAIRTDTGEVSRLTEGPRCQQVPVQCSPDGERLTLLTNRRGQLGLWTMRLDGRDAAPLTEHASPVSGGVWSPDGRWIAYRTNESRQLMNLDSYMIRPDGTDARRVFRVREGARDEFADWSPDGRTWAVTSDAAGLRRAGILDLQSGAVRWLSDPAHDETALRFSSDGAWLVCLRSHESQIRPVLYRVATGEARALELPPGLAYGSEFVLDDRALVALFMSETTRTSMVLYDLAADRHEPLIAPDYGAIDPAVFVPGEHIRYESFDGRTIPALVYRPRGLAAGDRAPAIVAIHGGPTGQWLRAFDPFVQFLVDLGCVVIEPNVRGSTGYGAEFRDLALHDWGGGDLEDIAHAARYLQRLPGVDPTRIGVFGGSYGGYLALMAATKRPELWRVACAWVGFSDLQRLYAGMMEHFKYYLRQQMGDPEENADLWRDRSPIHFAEALRARLLLVHGANDPRCPVEQARIFRDRLLELGRVPGRDFEYVEFADEGHGPDDIGQKIRTFELLAEFLRRNL